MISEEKDVLRRKELDDELYLRCRIAQSEPGTKSMVFPEARVYDIKDGIFRVYDTEDEDLVLLSWKLPKDARRHFHSVAKGVTFIWKGDEEASGVISYERELAKIRVDLKRYVLELRSSGETYTVDGEPTPVGLVYLAIADEISEQFLTI